MKIVNPEIFSPELEPIGFVNDYTSIMWNRRYNVCGGFELWCPLIPENVELLKDDNIIWLGGREAGIIKVLDMSNEGNDQIHIQGKFIDYQLFFRNLWDTHIYTNKNVSDILYDMVNVNCVNPPNKNRILPNWRLGDTSKKLGDIMTVQVTGKHINEVVEEYTQSHNLGFYSEFNPFNKTVTFNIYQGKDKSLNQSANSFVVFEYDTEDILSSTYFRNSLQYSNIAKVAGEDVGTARKTTIVGDEKLSGLARREMYVDARDLQSNDENGKAISSADYLLMLKQRGLEKLNEAAVVESYDATMRVDGNVKYEYGIDYDVGDIVTLKDGCFGVIMHSRITEIQEVYGGNKGYAVYIVFGKEQTILSYKVG